MIVELFSDMKYLNGFLTLTHGRVVSFMDLSFPQNERQWVHFLNEEFVPDLDSDSQATHSFGRLDIEVKQVHFIGLNQSTSAKLLILQRDSQVRQIVYYQDLRSIKAVGKIYDTGVDSKIIVVKCDT